MVELLSYNYSVTIISQMCSSYVILSATLTRCELTIRTGFPFACQTLIPKLTCRYFINHFIISDIDASFIQAYVCKFTIRDMLDKQVDLLLVLIASVADSSAFKEIHDNRMILEKELLRISIASKLVAMKDQQEFTGKGRYYHHTAIALQNQIQ